jgi:hypothetical protein
MTIERSADSRPNTIFESRELRVRSAGISAASATALVALAAAAALAFITVAQAQQQKKPAPPAARAAPAPHAVVRPPAPPPQHNVARLPSPPPQRTVTRSMPPQRTAIPNRPVTQPQTTHIPPITPPERTAIPNGAIGTPRSGQRTIPPSPRGPTQVGQSPTGLKFGPHGPIGTPQSGGRTIAQGPHGPTQAALSPTGLRFGPHGPIATSAHLRQGRNALRRVKPNFPVVTVNNNYFPIVRGEKFMHMDGHNRFFVPLGALGAVLIGGSYWNPDGYVSIAGPSCTGFTSDGCRLHWRMVDFADGGAEPQCVQYCRVAGPPPARIATLLPPPPLPPQGTCQMTIFSNLNFAGTSAPTGDNQANLSESGWQDEISSIQVQSGTWDFFTGDDYGGNTMRLSAGTYPTLTPDWDKKINSFMCVAPGPGA